MPDVKQPLLRCRSVKDGRCWASPFDLFYEDMVGYAEITLVVAGGRGKDRVAATLQLPPEQVNILRNRLDRTLIRTCPACRAAESLRIAPDLILAGHNCGRKST